MNYDIQQVDLQVAQKLSNKLRAYVDVMQSQNKPLNSIRIGFKEYDSILKKAKKNNDKIDGLKFRDYPLTAYKEV